MDDVKNIAITFQNLVQFYSMKHGIDALIERGYPLDIYIPINNDDSVIGNMFTETYDSLINMGYSPIRELDPKKHYKVLLEPYPMDIYYKFNFKYRIKYKYAPISAKPNLTLNPENNVYYDCILCFGNYEANYLRVYSNTKLIDNFKYIIFKKQKINTNKKVLLYLPTYGDTSSIEMVTDSITKLKNDYYIIAKAHHGTSFLSEESNRIENLKSICDEYYDHNVPLNELLQKAQIVLSDNSGAIFEALYSNTPVAVFCKDPNSNKIGNFDTTQFKLIKDGYIPYTNDSSKIQSILESALSPDIINKQINLAKSLFFHSDNPMGNFVSIIEEYLFDNIDFDYKNMHDVLLENYDSKINLINDLYSKNTSLEAMYNQKNAELDSFKNNEVYNLEAKIKGLEELVDYKNKTISYYEKGKLYKLSKSIYKLYYKIFKNKE